VLKAGSCILVCFSLHARKTAIGFYEKLAYAVVGGEFTEVGVAHVKMIKRIASRL
jgi:predicted GNAT family N-acyltransferase